MTLSKRGSRARCSKIKPAIDFVSRCLSFVYEYFAASHLGGKVSLMLIVLIWLSAASLPKIRWRDFLSMTPSFSLGSSASCCLISWWSLAGSSMTFHVRMASRIVFSRFRRRKLCCEGARALLPAWAGVVLSGPPDSLLQQTTNQQIGNHSVSCVQS